MVVKALPYRAKLCRAKLFVGRNFRRAKFWSISEKFVTFARRKIGNLSYFMRTQYNLYISAPSKNYSSGEIFVGRNYFRLEKSTEFLGLYDGIFEEQLKSGISEKVTKPGDVDNVMYLPHREVIKEGKSSTK